MHYTILVTVERNDYLDTSAKARAYVTKYLGEEGFVDGNHARRFVVQMGYGDYFGIGGRWSGLLTDHEYDLWELYGPPGAEGKSESEVLDLVFLGHEDDAQVVTDELYERFLKQWEEGAADVEYGRDETEDGFFVREHADGLSYDGFLDIEEEPVNRDFIGRKWLVVVDLHE